MKIPAIIPLASSILFAAICIGGSFWTFPFIVLFIMSLYMIYLFGSSLFYKEKIISLRFTDEEINMLRAAKVYNIDLLKIVDLGVESAKSSNALMSKEEIENNLSVDIEIFHIRKDNFDLIDKIKKVLEDSKKLD